MSAVRHALGQGLEGLRGSVRPLLLAWAASLGVALPLGAALYTALKDDLGQKIAGENLRVGWDDHWHRAFAAQASGIETTFDAGIVGIGAVLRALDAQIAGALVDAPAPVVLAGIVYAAVWVWLSGGFVARFVRPDDPRGFWSEAAAAFTRLAALALVMGAAYWIVLGPVRDGLGGMVEGLTIDTIDERVHFAWVLGKTAVVWGLVWTLSLVHDYARIARVSDATRSLPGALVDGARFVARHPRAAYGLSASVFTIGVVLLAAYAVIAPGAGQSNAFTLLVAFALSQLSVLGRIAMRVLGLAAAVALEASFSRSR